MDSNQEFNEESNLLDYFIVIIIFGLTGYILYKIFKQKNKSKRHPKINNINPRQNLPYSHNNNYGNNNELNYHNYNIGNFYKKKNYNNYSKYNNYNDYNSNKNIKNENYQNYNNNNHISYSNNSQYNMEYNNNSKRSKNNYKIDNNLKNDNKYKYSNKNNNIENFPEYFSKDNSNYAQNKDYKNNIYNTKDNNFNFDYNESDNYTEKLLFSGKKRNGPDYYNNFQENHNIDKFDEKKDNNISNNNAFKNPFENIDPDIKEEPKIGLNNIGATCYMNATLQCLSHTFQLTKYFLDPRHNNFINSEEKILSQYYLEVIKKLWKKKYNNNKNNYSPYNFKNIISQMNPLFQGNVANDAKDLVNFILEQLHLELNKTNQNQKNKVLNLNQYNESEVFSYFLNDFMANHCSIISDIFFGIIETRTECLQCKQKNQLNGIFNPLYLYNFQIINFIIFPLEEIRKFKNQINNTNSNEVELDDCFQYYEKEEFMQGDNQMWCQKCVQNTNSKYCTTIYSSPHYFIFILNRGKGNMFDVKLNFQEIIEISKYVEKKDGPNLMYQLYSIVTHIGPSSMSGHFIAFCKSPIDSLWYKYNDSQVELVGDFFQNIHEFGCPYILFYEKLKF